jgi:anti-sigma-K factor RskA
VSEHDQFRELIEAYALGALDASERAALEAHLASGCPECAKALEEARLVVTQLAYLAPPAEPSDMLRARVLRSVRADAASGGGGGSLPMQAGGAQRSSVPMWLWAGVAALLLFSLYSTWETRKMQRIISDTNQQMTSSLKERKQLEDELTMAKHEAWILTDPSSKKIMIMPSDKSMPMVEAMWHPKMGIYVTAQQMPMPKNNKVLQLWLIPKNGAKPMPSHVFWPDSNGKIGEMVANPPEDMAETKALAITEEPAGGSPQPTSTPMWVGGVS